MLTHHLVNSYTWAHANRSTTHSDKAASRPDRDQMVLGGIAALLAQDLPWLRKERYLVGTFDAGNWSSPNIALRMGRGSWPAHTSFSTARAHASPDAPNTPPPGWVLAPVR